MRVAAFVWLGIIATASVIIAQQQPPAAAAVSGNAAPVSGNPAPVPGAKSPQSYTSSSAPLTVSPVLTVSTGSISGTLFGDDGAPVAGIVIANSTGAAASRRSVSAADGSFVIANVPVGAYTLCARPNAPGYLDPCTWTPVPPKVNVTTGTSATAQIVLHKGAVVNIRVNDPQQALAAQTASPVTAPAAGTAVSPHLALFARTPLGLLEPLVITAQDAAGLNQETTIPFSTPVAISVLSNQIQIADSAGHSLSAPGSSITVQQTPSGPPTAVTLQVSKP